MSAPRHGTVLAFCETRERAELCRQHFEGRGERATVMASKDPRWPFVVVAVDEEPTHALSWDRGYLKFRKRLVEAAKGGIAEPPETHH